MLADFPEVKKEIQKFLAVVMHQQMNQKTPMASSGRNKFVYEGDKMGTVFPNGQVRVRELKSLHSEFSIPQKDIKTLGPRELLEKVMGMAEDMASQMERALLQALDEAIEESGNTISFGPDFNTDFLLAGLERMPVNFEDDDRNKPIKPILFAGPDTIEKLKDQVLHSTPEEREEYDRKEAEILDKKYEEYLEDLASRKIVD